MAKGEKKSVSGSDKSTLKIGKHIIEEWIAVANSGGTREMDPVSLATKIRGELVTGGGAHGPLEVGVIADPIFRESNSAGQKVKFIWICVPAPEDPTVAGLLASSYVVMSSSGNLVPVDNEADKLGEAVLFGCGR